MLFFKFFSFIYLVGLSGRALAHLTRVAWAFLLLSDTFLAGLMCLAFCEVRRRSEAFPWCQQIWSHTFLPTPHLTELMEDIVFRAASVTSQWKACRAMPAPVAPPAQDTHPLQPVGTVGTARMLHYCWLMESFPSFLQHITFFPQTTALGKATCQNWTVQSRKSSTEARKHTVCGEGKSRHKTQTSILECVLVKNLKLSGPLGENLTQLCDTV